MANTASNVVVGKPKTTGGVYAGPLDSTMPADPTTSLDADFVALGYITEDGVTMTRGGDTTPIRAWGGDEIRIIKTTDDCSFQFAFLETSVVVLKEVYGQDAVSTASGVNTVEITSAQLANRAFVFEVLDGDTAVRILVPNAAVTATSDVTFSSADAVSFGVTISAFPDATGVKAYIFHTLAA